MNLFRLWEIKNHLPSIPSVEITAVVCMALSPKRDGTIGDLMKVCIYDASRLTIAPIIFSNGFPLGESNIAEIQREYAKKIRISAEDIIIPQRVEAASIRNTFKEAEFAIMTVKRLSSQQEKFLLIVANHLHMRRVIQTFKKVKDDDVTLYWISVDDTGDYNSDYMQIRFFHPLLFLIYEMLAMGYSKMKGWI